MISSATAAFALSGLSICIAWMNSRTPAHTMCILLPIILTGAGLLMGIAKLCELELRELPPAIPGCKPKRKLKAKRHSRKRKRTA